MNHTKIIIITEGRRVFSHLRAMALSWHLTLTVARTPRPTAEAATPPLLTGPCCRPGLSAPSPPTTGHRGQATPRAESSKGCSLRRRNREPPSLPRPRAPPPGLAPHDCPPEPNPRRWSHAPALPLQTHMSVAPKPGPLHVLTPLPGPLSPSHPRGLFPHLLQTLLRCHLLWEGSPGSYRPETSLPHNRLSLFPLSGLQPSPDS